MFKIDAHCHLQDKRYGDSNIQIINDAINDNVKLLFNNSTGPNDWKEVESLALNFKEILPFYGVHPWYIPESNKFWVSELEDYLKNCPKCGVGEIGLDRLNLTTNLEMQEDVFIKQLELAKKYNKPVSVHCRGAWDRLKACMNHTAFSGDKLMIHSFSGSLGVVKQFLDSGCYFSFSGSCTGTIKKYIDAINIIPIERILTETDSPDIYPASLGGKKSNSLNIPQNVVEVIKTISMIKNITIEDILKQVYQNACDFINK